MKRTIMLSTVAAVLIGSAAPVLADRGPRGAEGPRGPQINFAELDADGNGQVTPQEARAHAAARFDAADSDGNGVLSAEEMAARIGDRARDEAMERAQSRLDRMIQWRDTDGDGGLSLDEMGQGDSARMFQRLDRDGDGAVSEEEFAALSKRGGEHRGMREGRMHRDGERGERGEHGKRGWGKRDEMRRAPMPAPDAPADDMAPEATE